MRSNPAQHFFISADLKSLSGSLLLSFIWLGEKNSLKYLLIGGMNVCPPHAWTVSTSLMPRLVNKNFNKIQIIERS